jgi:hypothetical protein
MFHLRLVAFICGWNFFTASHGPVLRVDVEDAADGGDDLGAFGVAGVMA